MSDKWIEGGWNGREPILPDDMPEFIWMIIYYDWSKHPKIDPFNKNNLKTFLHSMSLSYEAIDKNDGVSIRPPPSWMWQPINDVPETPKKKRAK
jgi:hypothetical protein